MADEPTGFTIVAADEVRDAYAGTHVPGEFHSLTEALRATQIAATLIRIPPHCDFEQGTGHTHDEIEELYLVARGELTMRLGEKIRRLGAGSLVRVAPATPRSHRNEGDEPVELWAFSRKVEGDPGSKIDDFWDASPRARQHVGPD